jgi:hypothetical protein
VSQHCALHQHSCKPVCPAEIEVRQRWALRQHSCKAHCPVWSDVIATEIDVHQLLALSQHSCKPICPGRSESKIAAEIKVRQRWALSQLLRLVLSFHTPTARVSASRYSSCHHRELPHHEPAL